MTSVGEKSQRQETGHKAGREGHWDLSEDPRLLHHAVAASDSGILITDPNLPDNPIVYANPAFERISGYRIEEILGHNCRFLQGPDRNQPAVEELRSALRELRDCRVILKNYRKDGALFWNELSVSPVRDETATVTHFIGIQNDVTGREKVVEDLRISESHKAAILKSALDAVITIDRDGRILDFNPAAERTFGYGQEQVIGKKMADMILPPPLRDGHREDLARHLSGGETRTIGNLVETSALRADGTEFPAEIAVTRIADDEATTFTVYIREITDRRQAEEALREEFERLSAIIGVQQEIATAQPDLETVMDLAATRMQSLTQADGAAVELVEGDEIVYHAASGTASSHVGMRLKVSSSLSGRCVQGEEILSSGDTERDPRTDREACRKIGARSMLVVPLRHAEKVVGVLKVFSTRTHAFDDGDVNTLRLMA